SAVSRHVRPGKRRPAEKRGLGQGRLDRLDAQHDGAHQEPAAQPGPADFLAAVGNKPLPPKSLQIRGKRDHPGLDCDGHMRDFRPLYLEYLRDTAGPQLYKRYLERTGTDVLGLNARGGERYGSPAVQDPRRAERRDWRTPRGIWFGTPTQNTLDAATVY